MVIALYASSFEAKSMIMYNTKFKKSKHIKPLEPRFEMGWFKSGEISTSIQSDGDFTVTGKIRF